MKVTKKHKKSGFTLVELMVVAIIVAILAAVAIPLMSGNKKRAAATEGQAGCSTIQTAQQVYRAENGAYMTSSSDPHNLPGITAGDLEGKYFGDLDYGLFEQTATGYKITATANDATDTTIKGGTVTLTVSTTDSTWGGTLLQ